MYWRYRSKKDLPWYFEQWSPVIWKVLAHPFVVLVGSVARKLENSASALQETVKNKYRKEHDKHIDSEAVFRAIHW